jgi:hypothetical protein
VIPKRRGEVRLVHFLILAVVVGGLGVVALAFFGYVSIGWFNQKNLKGVLESGVQTASGYSPAKTPTEAMDLFKKAIYERNYKAARKYTTKKYGELLERGHTAAAEMGDPLDRIRNYGKEKGILTDKVSYFLHQLDAFPKTFESDKPPESKGDKAYGSYKWTPGVVKAEWASEFLNVDKDMYNTVLAPPAVKGVIELVKEGDDWKLNIAVTPQSELLVAYYIDHYKPHKTGLDSFVTDINRYVYDNPSAYESEITKVLRLAKK